SALCLKGAENAFSANNSSPRAIAAEPILLDVSTASIRPVSDILSVFQQMGLEYVFLKSSLSLSKTRSPGDYFYAALPGILQLAKFQSGYYWPEGHKSNFSLAKWHTLVYTELM
ncbi:MAG: hypothetical protein JSW47_16855, partial [Phycisphaerales bacterium]